MYGILSNIWKEKKITKKAAIEYKRNSIVCILSKLINWKTTTRKKKKEKKEIKRKRD